MKKYLSMKLDSINDAGLSFLASSNASRLSGGRVRSPILRVAEIRTYLLASRLERPFAYSRGRVEQRSALLVELIGDSGLSGWGEAFGPPQLSLAAVEHLRPLVLNSDPLATEALWAKFHAHNREHGRQGPLMNAMSALDIALWDLKGRELGLPVHRLLGGPTRKDVPAYASGLFRAGDGGTGHLPREAAGYAEAGYRSMKMKVGFGVDSDIAAVRSVRQAIGPGVALMIDANEAYDATAAIRLGRAIEDLDIAWFEEPVPPDDLDGYRRAKAGLAMPIAGGEAEFGIRGFRNLLLAGALDILQPDICGAGGFTETRKIADMAHAFGVRLCPHTWGTAVAVAASLQLLAVLPDPTIGEGPVEPILEMDCTEHSIRDSIMPREFRPVNGRVRIPEGPGLGLTVDREALRPFQVRAGRDS